MADQESEESSLSLMISALNSNVLVRDVSIEGEKTSFAAASAFSFRCTDCTSGATCNKWRADLIARQRFILKQNTKFCFN